MIGGPASLAAFARAARGDPGALAVSVLDFDASDRLAYVTGAWSATSSGGGTAATGRVTTVLRRGDAGWAIRSQMFSADSAGMGLFAALRQVEPLPSLERRVAAGARAMVPTGRQERQDLRAVERIAAYRDLIAALAAARIAWSTDDAAALTVLLRADAWVQLPGGGAWAGQVSPADLQGALAGYGELHTAETDFDYGGTMAYLSGKYWAERTSGTPLTGSYLAVYQKLGSDWRIRSLTFY